MSAAIQPDSVNNVQIHASLWWKHKFCKTSSHAFWTMVLQIELLFACYVVTSCEITNLPVASVLVNYIKSESDLAGIAWVLV